jgi:single-strand DNA-binding protein
MSFSLNRASLIGVLGKDAETTFTTSNVAVTKFSVATTHSKKSKDGNWENLTTWHNVTAFELNDYTLGQLKKGAKVYVEGRIDNQTYEKDGKKKYFSQIVTSGFDGIITLANNSKADDSTKENAETERIAEKNEDNDLPF